MPEEGVPNALKCPYFANSLSSVIPCLQLIEALRSSSLPLLLPLLTPLFLAHHRCINFFQVSALPLTFLHPTTCLNLLATHISRPIRGSGATHLLTWACSCTRPALCRPVFFWHSFRRVESWCHRSHFSRLLPAFYECKGATGTTTEFNSKGRPVAFCMWARILTRLNCSDPGPLLFTLCFLLIYFIHYCSLLNVTVLLYNVSLAAGSDSLWIRVLLAELQRRKFQVQHTRVPAINV
jgi:hypothetical protein